MSGKSVMSMKDIQKQLAAVTSDQTARIEKNAGQSIGIKGKKFAYKGDVIGRVLSAVIVDFVRVNAFYDEAFHEDEVALPACMAISPHGQDMDPVDKSPRKQHEHCDGCPQNAWGSADVGRGKACAEQYRLAIMILAPGETYANADMAVITCPPTTKKNFGTYVKSLNEKSGIPPLAVVTELTFDDDFDYSVLQFEVSKALKSAGELNDILSRRDEAREMLMTPPDFDANEAQNQSAENTKGKRKKKVVKKKAATKKASGKKTSKKKTAGKKAGNKGRASKYAK